MVDVLSRFDPVSFSGWFIDFFVWFLPFIFVFIIRGLYYWVGGSIGDVIFNFFFNVINNMVRNSRLGFLGGSRLMTRRLFLLLLFVGVFGLMPFIPNIRGNGGFVVIIGLGFWLGIVLSRWDWAGTVGSLSTLVKDLDNVGLVLFFYWMEKLSAMLRIITLSVRFTVNIMVGQLAVIGWGTYMVYVYYGWFSLNELGFFYIIFCLIFGRLLIALEMVVVFIQVYLFCILLRLYGDDHCL